MYEVPVYGNLQDLIEYVGKRLRFLYELTNWGHEDKLCMEWLLMKIEEGLGFDNCYLVGISVEGVNVQLVSASFKVDVAERLQAADSQ